MDQPLDLSITLTKPPQGSPPEAIANIALRCDKLGLAHTGDLLYDPLTPQERDDLHWYLEEYWKWPYEQFLTRGRHIEDLLANLGEQLYGMVFGNGQAKKVGEQWLKLSTAQHQISIVSEIPSVLSLPWELLHDAHGFLALRPNRPIPIVRRLLQSEQSSLSTSFEPPLRVLLVTARPEDTGFIDPRGIAHELVDEVQTQVEEGTIELEFLRPPTLSALHTRLRDRERPQVHLFHFDGHGGVFDEEKGGQGVLFFETSGGRASPVKASDLAKVLRGSGIRLAVLTACQSAISATNDAFSSVAAQLIQGGIDAVVAMSASVLAASATRYVEAFYRALAAGTSAPMAQEQARRSLYDDPRRHLLRRRRDEEGKPIEIRDWWLPHFYQQRPVNLQPTEIRRERIKPQQTSPSRRLNEEIPPEPRYGFSGRARELLQIERWLLQGKLVAIHGFGGVGKTVLAREAADWLTRTKMYDGACFVSFEHSGDVAMLFSTLGNYLGVYDGNYNPNDEAAALARLKPILKERRTLVIADNLESVLPNGQTPLEAKTRTQLWDALLDLVQIGTGVLLTSRDTAFGDSRLVSGKLTAYLALGGLHPEDAYALASRLLDSLEIDRTRAPYAEVRDLLAQLDHHPLAIQQVLPALRELSLAKVRADFATLLPRFVDDMETGRNRSLLASLEYSLRRLDEEQRLLLPRLAIFEGGASEVSVLTVTEIHEDEWARLRAALEQVALLTAEQVALLTAEQVHEALAVPFLRFHPVLAPFLRSQIGADDAALRERYTQYYHSLSAYLYDEDFRHPHQARAWAYRELPNLRHALALLLEADELEVASDLTDYIAKFLNYFGLQREHDEIRRVVDARFSVDAHMSDVLTRVEYLHESGLGEDEYRSGNIRAASDRFTALLARIETQPEGAALGRESYEYCLTLIRLARCLRMTGKPAAAEGRLREALTVIDMLLKKQPEKQTFSGERSVILGELGDVLYQQGQYDQARIAYEEALQVDKQLGDLRGQAVAQGQLGSLALIQQNYAEARSRHTSALELFRALGEPTMEASTWIHLGAVAQVQEEWAEAERCYRESLMLEEQHGDEAGVGMSCYLLAKVAVSTDRPTEAEGWFKRTLEIDERVYSKSPKQAFHLTDLADLLVDEVRTGHAPETRLAEAQGYAEQALAIEETLERSAGIWTTLFVLAEIAELEGRAEVARDYRRRERESFAAFAGNRYDIDHQYGPLITDIAAAALGDMQMWEKIELTLPKFSEAETKGWRFPAAIRRIVAGERDWHLLVEDMDRDAALLVLLILNAIALMGNVQSGGPEQIIDSPPATLGEALAQDNEVALEQPLKSLLQKDPLGVEEALQRQEELPARAEHEQGGHADTLSQLGDIAWEQGKYEEAQRLYSESLAILEELGDQGKQARTLLRLGNVALVLEKYEEAQRLYSESLAIFEELSDQSGRAKVLHQLGMLAQRLEEYEEAQHLYHESLVIKDQLGDQSGRAKTLSQLGVLVQRQGKYEEAQRLYSESLAILEELGDQSGREKVLHQLGDIAWEQGKYEEAQRLYSESLAILEELGDQGKQARTLLRLGNAALVLEKYEEAQCLYSEGLAIFEQLGDQAGYATALQLLGMIVEEDITPEQVIASLPDAIREALEQGNAIAIQQAIEALSLEEQQEVMKAIRYLQSFEEDA